MPTTDAGQMTDGRALVTDREIEILLREDTDVSRKYHDVVVSRVRNRIQRLGDRELEALQVPRADSTDLLDELREQVCDD